ncbi:MAG: hypothetical protein HGA35_06030 [Erysipelotrichaceae bacterium]|nr:hypothetical protein [Erysipelotrichaceae bacterium]
MAVLIKRKKLIEYEETEEIIVDAPTVADAIRILKSTREEDIPGVFEIKSNTLGSEYVKASYIDVDECKIIPSQTKLDI